MIGSSFLTLVAATEKARLPKLSFVLGTISCYEVDDLMDLEQKLKQCSCDVNAMTETVNYLIWCT